ncbi:dihydrolipoyl dehydrogenase family protein [Tabrizicola sp.]|uniref:dihydrolipoyl dehydrogenase family protein n=1 Tax=Tabrizicola sp. TaxID=2005166 RepID=UPI003F37B689
MPQIKTDICVIGAGSGGLSVAAGAVQMGARVVLIEAGEMGGDCLNAGCVPSKALIAAAKAAEAQRRGFRGVAAVKPKVDFGAVKDHVAAVIAQIAPVDSQERFEGLGCTVIRAFARFTGPREVEAGEHTIRARRFVIATGSRPFVPQVQGIETVPYLTNETIFGLRERPEHLIVIGGGPIGVEMAQAHRRLGSKVTIVEAAKVLGREDPELAAVLIEALEAEGIDLIDGAPVVRLAGSAGAVEVTLGDGRQATGSHILMAVGRKVSVEGMNLEAAGIAYTPKGITVDARLRSSNRRVYAVGDAAGGLQFTHVAGWHAGIVIRQAVLGLPAKADLRAVPRATYTDPELAQVGLTEAEARAAHGAALTVVRAEFHHNDRAQAEGKDNGLIKVMIVKGRPVGASIVGPQAGELIGLWALAINAKLKMSAIAGMVAPYPTLGEVSKRAAGAYFGPQLFESPTLKRIVRLIQRLVP